MVLRWDHCWFPRWREMESQQLKTLKFGIKTFQIGSDLIWSEVWATLLLQNPSHNLRLGLSGFSHVSIVKGTTAKRLSLRGSTGGPPGLLAPEPLNLRSSQTIFSFITLAETSFTTMTSKQTDRRGNRGWWYKSRVYVQSPRRGGYLHVVQWVKGGGRGCLESWDQTSAFTHQS